MNDPDQADTSAYTRLEAAMLAGEVAWWEMDVETGAVEFHDSKAEMLGYDAGEFEHFEDFTELLHPGDHERAMEAMRSHLEGRADKYDVEYRIKAADGTYHWFHDVGGVSARTEEGGPKTVAGIVVDISERKEAAAEATRKNEQLALLNRIIRHDIANDMTVARGNLDLLAEDVPADGKEHLERVRSATDHVLEITESVGTVLEVLEDESHTGEGTTVRLDAVLREQVDAIDSMFDDAEVVLDGDLPEVSVLASPLLASALANIIENAIEHNDTDHPRIEVSVEVAEAVATVRIADDGPGIPEEQKEAVFDLGESGSATGSGMGLFIAATLVEAFGGSIEIGDNEPRGSVFRVTLKRA